MEPTAPPAPIPYAYPLSNRNKYTSLEEVNDENLARRLVNEEQNNQQESRVIIVEKNNGSSDLIALGCMGGLMSALCCTIM